MKGRTAFSNTGMDHSDGGSPQMARNDRPAVLLVAPASPAYAPCVSEPRRPRHLLDPNDIAGSHQRSQGTTESLTRVQRWVMSVLAVTTIAHLSAGVALVAILTDHSRLGARIGLDIIAGVIGLAAVAAGLLIHGKSALSGWLLVGLVPMVVGFYFIFT
jgi:hypothetical protein